MRWADMTVGQTYRLNTGSKVTLLATPSELRRRARVLVRFETGVKRGEETELACVRIVEPWAGPVPRKVLSQPRALPAYIAVHRPPRPGDIVTWTTTGGMLWDVSNIDAAAGTANVTGEVLAQSQTHTVPIDQLTVMHRTASTKPTLSPYGGTNADAAGEVSSEPDRDLAPDRPRRRLEEILDSLVFTRACLDEYRRRCAPRTPKRDIADALRDEIRAKGYIPGDQGSQALRLRVDHRFEISLPETVDPDETIRVSELRYLSRRKQPPATR